MPLRFMWRFDATSATYTGAAVCVSRCSPPAARGISGRRRPENSGIVAWTIGRRHRAPENGPTEHHLTHP